MYGAGVRRTVAAAALTPFWLCGLMAAALARPLRWAGAAAADGWEHGVKWKWSPALGALTVALTVTAVILLLV